MKIACGTIAVVLALFLALLVARCSLPPSEEIPDGAGGLFWLVWLLDHTIGLPDPPERHPEFVETAWTFLDRFDAGELDAARALMTDACREAHPPEPFAKLRETMGPVAPREEERRWHSLQAPSEDDGSIGTRARIKLSEAYGHGLFHLEVHVVRTEDGYRVNRFDTRRKR